MSLENKKISVYADNIAQLSDRPADDGISSEQLKALFDGRTDNEIKQSINGIIDELIALSGAAQIGAEVGNESATNVQGLLDSYKAALSDRYTKQETVSLIAGDISDLVKNVSVSLSTGIITVTKQDGSTQTFDTALEKVPASFTLLTRSGSVYLRITNVDGSYTETDVTSLLNIYDFQNSSTVAFTVSGSGNEKTVTASLRNASVTLDMLDVDVISTIQGYAETASAAAGRAIDEAEDAAASAADAENAALSAGADAESAYDSKIAASTSADAAALSETAAVASAIAAESWAVGGTGSRSGEDTNNAKYWCEQAQDAASGVNSFNGRTGVVMPQSGDYTAAQVGADASGTAQNLINALDYTSPEAASTTSTTFIDTVSQTNGLVSATKKTLPSASTSAKGIVQLSSSTSSTSTTLAATASAVKAAYDHGGVTSVNGKTGSVTLYQYSTTDLTAGSSSLATGTLYFVYE